MDGQYKARLDREAIIGHRGTRPGCLEGENPKRLLDSLKVGQCVGPPAKSLFEHVWVNRLIAGVVIYKLLYVVQNYSLHGWLGVLVPHRI